MFKGSPCAATNVPAVFFCEKGRPSVTHNGQPINIALGLHLVGKVSPFLRTTVVTVLIVLTMYTTDDLNSKCCNCSIVLCSFS